MPNLGHSSQRGEMFGLGYFWAINRSYDVTYRVQDFTARGFTHHVDFRAKPRPGSNFDLVLYGVQDRGLPDSGNPPIKYSGISLYAVGRSDLGNGWTASGNPQLHHLVPLPPGVDGIVQRSHRLGGPFGRVHQQELVYLHGEHCRRPPRELRIHRNPNHRPGHQGHPISHQRGDHPQAARSRVLQPRPRALRQPAGLVFARIHCRPALPLRPRIRRTTVPGRSVSDRPVHEPREPGAAPHHRLPLRATFTLSPASAFTRPITPRHKRPARGITT